MDWVQSSYRDLKGLAKMLDAAGKQHLQILTAANFAAKVLINSGYVASFHALQHVVNTGPRKHVYVARLLQGDSEAFAHTCIRDRIPTRVEVSDQNPAPFRQNGRAG